MAKALSLVFLSVCLLACTSSSLVDKVTLYGFAYPPYALDENNGLVIELIREALKSQGMQVEFDIDTLENTYKTAMARKGIVVGSRMFEFSWLSQSNYVEFIELATYLVSIEGRGSKNILGTFSSDEIDFAKANNMEYREYTSPKQGLEMLYNGEVGSIICTDISCDQIKASNPELHFTLEYAYSFPIDFVFFETPQSPLLQKHLDKLKAGIEEILGNGVYFEIQEKYKVANPIFQLPMSLLVKVKAKE